MAKIRALGTIITFDSKAVGALTSIGELAVTSDEIDKTTLDSANGYREFFQGFKDSGELPLTGYYDKTDVGQAGIIAEFATGDVKACVITFPNSGGGATFNAFVKGYSIGSADVDGVVGFGATLRITGAVTPT